MMNNRPILSSNYMLLLGDFHLRLFVGGQQVRSMERLVEGRSAPRRKHTSKDGTYRNVAINQTAKLLHILRILFKLMFPPT